MTEVPISKPLIGEEEKQAVLRVLDSGRLAQGPRVRAFEEAFAAACGVPEAVALSSGTAALMVALLAHDVGPGDEVITSPFTFVATANVILLVGARPVFVDVREDDFNVDPALIEGRITAKTKALLPVHLFGQTCDMDAIMDIAHRHGLAVIEDACQAHGATYKGRAAGSFGHGCFSFYATKNMTTGEGGMITTNDKKIADRARLLRDHGQTSRYHTEAIGYNLRLTEVAAAIGEVQLGRLAEFNERRRANARYLSERLRGVILPAEHENRRHVYHQYTVRIPSPDGSPAQRDAVAARLHEAGIQAQIYYPVPVHCQPPYRKLGYADSLPFAERLSREVLSLPVHPAVTEQDLGRIVSTVNAATDSMGGTA